MLILLSRLGQSIPAIVAAALLAGCGVESTPEPLYSDVSEGDVTLAARAAQDALEHTVNGETRTWRNPATGSEGAIYPATHLPLRGRPVLSGLSGAAGGAQPALWLLP